MMARKQTKVYYFSVEGATEKWYFHWLQDQINAAESADFSVSLKCDDEQNPIKRVKNLSICGHTTIYHLCDYESSEKMHTDRFLSSMDEMQQAMKLGKQVTYKFAYSNLTFDLWMILHKMDCRASVVNREIYIRFINKGYNESFDSMREFKRRDNFKRCLKKLTLSDVITAVQRAELIMENNEQNGYVLHRYRKWGYYEENPSLMVWEPVKIILTECGIMKKKPKR